MATDTWLVLDVATAPIEEAKNHVKARSNLKDPKKIEADLEEKAAKAGLDPDLARVTGIGMWMHGQDHGEAVVARSLDDELEVLQIASKLIGAVRAAGGLIVTFNGLSFDLPVLMRRSWARRVSFPSLAVDPPWHAEKDRLHDVMLDLAYNKNYKSLAFYADRYREQLDLPDGLEKPLTGQEESAVLASGDWQGLERSLLHDITVTRALAMNGPHKVIR
jgi:predicted PolB exonuclease-like 3'-5' exonuclease